MKEIKIKKITSVENEDVYDINVSDNHNFFANGILVHNCGEQVMPINSCCLLGSLNLTQFVDIKNNTWDYKKLESTIPVAIRMMDNVNDLTYLPLPEQREALVNKRRLGLGIMGYGSALLMMKIRYGSDEAKKMTEELMNFIKNTAYQSSVKIAIEKGPFPLFDKEKYLKGVFIQGLSEETQKLIEKHGIRNSHLLSVQPTGNTGILANNVSGGLEPLFLPTYIRTVTLDSEPIGVRIPVDINWAGRTFTNNDNSWEWNQEGDEWLLTCKYNNTVFKVDQNRGLTKEAIVRDYGVRFLEDKKEWDPNASYLGTVRNLSVEDHIETMKIITKHIDSSCSKTINLPENYVYEDFKNIYLNLYETGTIKGGTTYRMGTMTSVLSEVKKPQIKSQPERPKTLDCDIHQLQVNKDEWTVLVGLIENIPYEVFAFKKKGFALPKKLKKGKLTKVKRGGIYNLETEDGYTMENIREFFQQDEEQALTRMISLSLRRGIIDLHEVVEQLNKSEGNILSFSKAIARTLKRYIPDNTKPADTQCDECGDKNGLVYENGCVICKNCGASKC